MNQDNSSFPALTMPTERSAAPACSTNPNRAEVALRSFERSRPVRSLVALTALVATLACEDHYHTNNYYTLTPEAGTSDPGSESETDPDEMSDAGTEPSPADSGDAGVEAPPHFEGAPTQNADHSELALDVFGTHGNRYWFAVAPEQLEVMNERMGGGGGPIIGWGDIYTPGGTSAKTYVDGLFVTTAGDEPQTANYGQVGVRLIGQSTARPWTKQSIPNLRLNLDTFTPGLRLGGNEHVRFNNGLVGSIYREKLTLDIYRNLGYPAPRAAFAWVGSNVWGPEVSIPYTVVEVYKKSFCKNWEDELGGGCVNMWEFAGDFGFGVLSQPDSCQSDSCDDARALEFEELVMETEPGEGFKQALAEWFDWEAFHRFQCLSWILATGDDALHNQNNVLLVERADGMFQYLPYSVDISLGQDWYPDVPLTGTNRIASGCQNDSQCWEDTITTCEELVQQFSALDPVGMTEDLFRALESEGMLRDGDDGRYQALRRWFERRLEQLPDELEANRELPQTCVYPYVLCNDACVLEWECFGGCVPPGVEQPIPEPRPLRDAERIAIAPPDPEAGGEDAIALPLPIPGDDGGAGDPPVPGPIQCPEILMYAVE